MLKRKEETVKYLNDPNKNQPVTNSDLVPTFSWLIPTALKHIPEAFL